MPSVGYLPLQFSPVQIKLQKQHRQLVRAEAESDKDWDARRDLVLVSWYVLLTFVQILFFYKRKQTRSRWMLGILFRRCYAKNTRKRKCSKKTGQEGWGRRTAASGLNESAGSGFHVAALSDLGSSLAYTHHGRTQDFRLQGPRRLPHMSPPATISLYR